MLSEQQVRIRASLTSLVVGGLLLAAKFLAYSMTGSTAVLSDALESIVNVVAAAFLIGSVLFAGVPADRNHPYGHGKIEFFAAAFEGGLITFAAVATLAAAGSALVRGPEVRELDTGLLLTGAAGAVNLALGLFLVKVGRSHRSLALEADGHHVLTDVWSTAAILVGLFLVKVTGIQWFDPLLATGMGLALGLTGLRLVRRAAGGLLDEYDPDTVARLLEALEQERSPGLIRVHHLRALRFGAHTHVDAHLVLPEFWSLERSHALVDGIERKIRGSLGQADVMFHADPCRRAYCAGCEVDECAIRSAPFVERPRLTLDEAERPDDE